MVKISHYIARFYRFTVQKYEVFKNRLFKVDKLVVSDIISVIILKCVERDKSGISAALRESAVGVSRWKRYSPYPPEADS